MPRDTGPSVTGALFGPLPESVRRRHGLSPVDGTGGPPHPRANPPQTAWGLHPREWRAVLKDTARGIGADRVTSVAGGVAFFSLLALVPAITALVSIFGLVADPALIGDQVDSLAEIIPPAALEIISGQVGAIVNSSGTALSIAGIGGLLTALWMANGGMKALLEALNMAWGRRDERGIIRLNLLSLAMTLGAIALLSAMVVAIAVVPAVLGLLPLPEATRGLVSMIRWPIMFAVLLLTISLLYRWGPDRAVERFVWISPGVLLASVGLVGASALFSFYASNFAHYNETYGALGAVVVVMMWLWISSIVILTGAELNAACSRYLHALRDGKDEQ